MAATFLSQRTTRKNMSGNVLGSLGGCQRGHPGAWDHLGKAGFTFRLSGLLGCLRLPFPASTCDQNPRNRTDFQPRSGSVGGAVHRGAPSATRAGPLKEDNDSRAQAGEGIAGDLPILGVKVVSAGENRSLEVSLRSVSWKSTP